MHGHMSTHATQTARNAATDTPGLVRWGAAASTARTLASAGPKFSTSQAIPVVEDIRAKAEASVEHVHRITGLQAARDLRDSQVLVVDRAGWATAAVGGFREMLDPPLRAALAERFPEGLPLSLRLGGYGVAAELGGLVAFLASHVLGQYDPFSTTADAPGGRLLLVAPNLVQVQRKLEVDAADFRLWVALHEQTHRVQFAAAPWLREHLAGLIAELAVGMVSRSGGSGGLKASVSALGGGVRGDVSGKGDPVPDAAGQGLISLVTGPRERQALSDITAVMSLLEGHANVVMDSVDTDVIPTVATIRERFEQRGSTRSALQKLIMRLIGMAAKQRQYSDGAAFVRAAVEQLGMEGFNAVFTSAEHLPTEQELHAPERWIERMRGGAGTVAGTGAGTGIADGAASGAASDTAPAHGEREAR